MVFKMKNLYISKSKTDLPIMKPFIIRESPYGNLSKWLVNFSPGIFIFLTLVAIFWPFFTFGQNNYTIKTAFDALIKWIPFLFWGGFLFWQPPQKHPRIPHRKSIGNEMTELQKSKINWK